jgi:hypothetical protein
VQDIFQKSRQFVTSMVFLAAPLLSAETHRRILQEEFYCGASVLSHHPGQNGTRRVHSDRRQGAFIAGTLLAAP